MTHRVETFGRIGRRAAMALLAVAFVVRLLFGVTNDFWGDDELQIYLIGLRYYATGVWPLYGPDVVYTKTQVPGGLQGLLVGGPFWVVAQPEAPYVLLNVLSFGALLLLGWYIAQRHPSMPRWWLWSWIFFSPWTLNMSAHVVNTSYVMVGAVIYTVSALELCPSTRLGVIRRSVAWFGLGAGTLWVYQEHLSAALLVVLAAVVAVLSWRDDRRATLVGLPWAVAGAALVGVTLVPTLMAVGLAGVAGRTGANLAFEPENLLRVPQIVAQFFSFGSMELPRFMGASTRERLTFLSRYPWAAPFVVTTVVAGVVQAVGLAVGAFTRRRESSRERGLRRITRVVLAAIAVSFSFSIKAPASHAFYVAMPLVVIYAFSWWTILSTRAWARRLALVLTMASAVSHLAIASRNFTDRSLYRDRARVVEAIQDRDYRRLGERRPEIWRREDGSDAADDGDGGLPGVDVR